MAQNITIQGASYSDVPSVTLPKTGGGTAWFTDVTPTTAVESDVASGKVFFKGDGSQSTGTASYPWVLLASGQYTVNTSSTSNTKLGDISAGSAAYTKDNVIWVRIRDKSSVSAGHFFGSDTLFFNATKANGGTSSYNVRCVNVIRYNSSSQYECYNGSYGVYASSISSAGKVAIYSRYNSTYTLTINSTYSVEVYSLSLPTGETIF